jgi:DNA repair protein RecN (Recombination protein N)
MLLSLRIRQFVIVDELDLDFNTGFTVLTGETGAGKSIILDALGLILGDKADAQQIRAGHDKADLSASFSLTHLPALKALLASLELLEDDLLIIRRILDRQGRSSNRVNGHSVNLTQLKLIGEHLINIHGQHAHQSLIKAAHQRQLLDDFAGLLPQRQAVKAAYLHYKQSLAAYKEAQTNAANLAYQHDKLTWQLEELNRLQPEADEWDTLNAVHARVAHAAEIQTETQWALNRLTDEDKDLLSQLAQTKQRLIKLSRLDASLDSVIALLDSAETDIQEAVHGQRPYTDELTESDDLLTIENRMQAYTVLAKKYRTDPEALFALQQQTQADLAALTQAADVAGLAETVATAQRSFEALALPLRADRIAAAPRLAAQIEAEMNRLAMTGARFEVQVKPMDTPTAEGLDQVEFLVAANLGSPPQPLGKVASGGELSRISLALQMATSNAASVPTLIFDEVDAGIGGRVAETVGRLLQALGRQVQVIAITHLPQVAAFGHQQWAVRKYIQDHVTLSSITPLSEADRLQEIARMLGGEAITATTKDHAQEMLSVGLAAQQTPLKQQAEPEEAPKKRTRTKKSESTMPS